MSGRTKRLARRKQRPAERLEAAQHPKKMHGPSVTPGEAVTTAGPRLETKPRCGLCGKKKDLVRTECCGNWICDDYRKYVMFSFATNSCRRNHDRYTLCSAHHNGKHEHPDWRTCDECRSSFDTEDYVWFGTNEFNFVKLEKPPKFKPTRCARCNAVIRRGEETYSMLGGDFYCSRCSEIAAMVEKRRRRALGKGPR